MSKQAATGEVSDATLVRGVQLGDRSAEFELDQRWRPRLVALARSILHDDDLAEDAAQIALWRANLHLDRYDKSRPFEPWILKIAGNVARDHLRRRRPSAFTDVDGPFETAGGMSTPEAVLASCADEVQGLRDCLEELGERSRTVAVLFALGFSLAETGRVFASPKTTVQAWLNKALAQLRRCMAGKGSAQ